MAKYVAILNATWDDPAFQSWSSNGKLVFLNLITSMRHNPVGLYAVTENTLIFETGLSKESFRQAFTELQAERNGYPRVRYDDAHQVVWVTNALKHQPSINPQNRNLIICVQAVLKQYSQSPLTEAFKERYKEDSWLWDKDTLVRVLGGAFKPPNKDKSKDKDKDKSIEHKTTDHQFLIDRFLELQGTPRESATPEYVNGQYKRHSRSAVALIKESGGIEYAKAALEWGATYFGGKSLTWTLDTIAKHLPTFARCGRDEAIAKQYGLNPSQVQYAKTLSDWLKRKRGNDS